MATESEDLKKDIETLRSTLDKLSKQEVYAGPLLEFNIKKIHNNTIELFSYKVTANIFS